MSDMATVKALRRVRDALDRAEAEYPILAAPDGTVAVSIVDLRTVLQEMDRMRDTLALGRQEWRERWYGSPPERGSSIVTVRGDLVAYVGGDQDTHDAVSQIVATHNASLGATS
jgi:hypothetical protein